jgi:hypothetical protein
MELADKRFQIARNRRCYLLQLLTPKKNITCATTGMEFPRKMSPNLLV